MSVPHAVLHAFYSKYSSIEDKINLEVKVRVRLDVFLITNRTASRPRLLFDTVHYLGIK